MTSKHTPGPWRYSRAHNDVISMSGGISDDVICDLVANNEANARLIAAAPKLLEALQEQVDECFDDMCEMCARHQRVIAKAKGQ